MPYEVSGGYAVSNEQIVQQTRVAFKQMGQVSFLFSPLKYQYL